MESLQFGLPLNGAYAEKDVQSCARLSRDRYPLHVRCRQGFNEIKSIRIRTLENLDRNPLDPIKDSGKGNGNQNNHLLNFGSASMFAAAAASSERENWISAEQIQTASTVQISDELLQTSKWKEEAAGSHNIKRDGIVFTPEKARILRQKLRLLDSWHDTMYHSAIASRLALQDN